MESFLLITKIGVTSIYILCLTILCIFGLNRYYLVYLKNKFKDNTAKPIKKYTTLPKVTVQLPVFNEIYVVERLIDSVCKLDYPAELLEIQVLDDSIDNTREIAQKCVEYHSSMGIDIKYIYRKNREGYKAGALENGLKHASGELIAIFDADFIPPSDFLIKTVHQFTDDNVGIVQTRWGHINRNYSTLTRAQSILLDGHFVIEQNSRFNGGYFLNFNGTAGIIRKRCIESSGGWQHDTLTEDLDLSYRAQIEGWKMVYLDDVVVEAELPVDINSFKSQQHRWAKGGIQTAIKLLPKILMSKNIDLRVKIQCIFHLLANISYPLLILLIILMLPVAYFWRSVGWYDIILLSLLAITAGTISVFNFYIIAVKEVFGKNWIHFSKYIPISIALGSGIAINNTKAVIEALFRRKTEFARTPKFAVINNSDSYKNKSYKSSINITTFVELILGITLTIETIYAFKMGFYGWIPFLLIIQAGFLYTSLYSIITYNSNNLVTKTPRLRDLAPLKSK